MKSISAILRVLAVAFACAAIIFCSPQGKVSTVTAGLVEQTQERLQEAYGTPPLSFIRNEGQLDESVKFYRTGRGHRLYLTSHGLRLDLIGKSPAGSGVRKRGGTVRPASEARVPKLETITLLPVGANSDPTVVAEGRRPGRVNYLIGNDPQKWVTGVSTYETVTYKEIYPGIDLRFHGGRGNVEYDFLISPGIDPGTIRMRYDGVKGLELEGGGRLIAHTSLGDVILARPHVYQDVDGTRKAVEGQFVLGERNGFSFRVGAYDRTRQLIIDPVITYSTFLGGSGDERGPSRIAVDAAGNAYVTSGVDSLDFPTANPLQPSLEGPVDIIITKLDPTGSSLVYSTYLGGTNIDRLSSIALDAGGRVYVTGQTFSADFPTVNAFQSTLSPSCCGSSDAFVLRLNADGSALDYSTYLGGDFLDSGDAIAADASGSAYVTGTTYSNNFPTSAGAFQEARPGFRDGFVTKFNPDGSSLAYSTYLGGSSGNDNGNAIAVDVVGNAIVAGENSFGGFPTTANAFQPISGNASSSGGEIFVAKLNSTGSGLLYSSYLGGSGLESSPDVALDPQGSAYVSGITNSSDFPVLNAYQAVLAGSSDAFITKINPNGSALVYSTYLGPGVFGSAPSDIDSSGNVYITGRTSSNSFPTLNAFQPTRPGSTSAFVTKLDASGGSLVYSSYLGGSDITLATGIAVGVAGNVYITGATTSMDFPTTVGAFQANLSGIWDLFVTKIGEPVNSAPIADAGPDQAASEGDLVTLDGSGSNDPDGDPMSFEWVQVGGPAVVLDLSDPLHPTFWAPSVPVGGATLSFSLTVSDGELTSQPDIVNVTVADVNNPPVADAGDDQTVQEGSPVNLDGSQSFDLDGQALTFSWLQIPSATVVLSDPADEQPSFISPMVGPAGETLTFELTVSDGIDTGVDTVDILVENVNQVPVAHAGADQTKNEGSLVTLDGTASSDPDGDALSFFWTQIAGTAVTLSDANSPAPAFTAPAVGLGGDTLVFRLVVNDDLDESDPDDVSITVLNVNDPPACELAMASDHVLWPPDHKLMAVRITGVTDPDNDQVVITVAAVTQDEPVDGLGSGDTSPDAVLLGDQALLRAERGGGGNGRVYQVSFEADDGSGGVCTGSVTVMVPHDRKSTAIDDGQLYNSLLSN